MSNIDKQTRKEAIINRLVSSFEPGSITDTQLDALSDTVDLLNVLFFEADAAEKRIAGLEERAVTVELPHDSEVEFVADRCNRHRQAKQAAGITVKGDIE